MLQIKSLSKSFGSQVVLTDVDFQIESGEFFALLGPSGCGKTTLLRILAGLERADRGELHLDGERIDSIPPNRRPCHMVFQRYALFPHLDVGNNVAFALQLQGLKRDVIRERVAEALTLVEMQGLEQRSVMTLSGGQQQRVALARALVSRPRYLLLDEPLSALDQKLRLRMQIELRALQRRLGITFIFVTHDQDEALTLADRIAVMRRGQIEQIGAPKDLYGRPRTAFVAGFVGQINELSGKLITADTAEVSGLGLVSVVTNTMKIGSRVRIILRPEHLQLLASDAEHLTTSTPKFAAIVEHVFFKGSYCEVIVGLSAPGSIRLAVHLQTSNAASLHIGSPVYIVWPQHAARAFVEDTDTHE